MKKFLEVCAGIDVGKREIAVTILSGSPAVEPTAETRTLDTTATALAGCLQWLLGKHCTTVVMESTGSYWIPVWNVLSESVAVIVANPDHVKARRGEKTDPADSRRLAERLRVGEVRGSFIPTKRIVELRDLTRRRKRLLTAASSERNRVQKLLEQGSVKIGNVVSDVFGMTGQRILDALLRRPELRPEELADLAQGSLRKKAPQLTEALRGHRLDEHLRWMIQNCMDHLVFLEKQITQIGEKIAESLKPLEREYELLQTIPGVRDGRGDSGGNRREYGAVSERSPSDELGRCLSREQQVSGQTEEQFDQAGQPLVIGGVSTGRLGSGTKAWLDL